MSIPALTGASSIGPLVGSAGPVDASDGLTPQEEISVLLTTIHQQVEFLESNPRLSREQLSQVQGKLQRNLDRVKELIVAASATSFITANAGIPNVGLEQALPPPTTPEESAYDLDNVAYRGVIEELNALIGLLSGAAQGGSPGRAMPLVVPSASFSHSGQSAAASSLVGVVTSLIAAAQGNAAHTQRSAAASPARAERS